MHFFMEREINFSIYKIFFRRTPGIKSNLMSKLCSFRSTCYQVSLSVWCKENGGWGIGPSVPDMTKASQGSEPLNRRDQEK